MSSSLNTLMFAYVDDYHFAKRTVSLMCCKHLSVHCGDHQYFGIIKSNFMVWK